MFFTIILVIKNLISIKTTLFFHLWIQLPSLLAVELFFCTASFQSLTQYVNCYKRRRVCQYIGGRPKYFWFTFRQKLAKAMFQCFNWKKKLSWVKNNNFCLVVKYFSLTLSKLKDFDETLNQIGENLKMFTNNKNKCCKNYYL